MRVLAPVLLVALTAACTQGDSAEERTVSRDATPAASDIDGGRVDLGGYELAYECRGTGEPTIVTEAGYDSAGTTTWS